MYTSTECLNTRSATSSQWSSSCSSRDKPLSNFRVLLTTRAAEFHHTLQLVCCDLRRPGQYGIAVVNARSHKRMDECRCCSDSASNDCRTRRICLRWKKQAALTTETCFSRLRSGQFYESALPDHENAFTDITKTREKCTETHEKV